MMPSYNPPVYKASNENNLPRFGDRIGESPLIEAIGREGILDRGIERAFGLSPVIGFLADAALGAPSVSMGFFLVPGKVKYGGGKKKETAEVYRNIVHKSELRIKSGVPFIPGSENYILYTFALPSSVPEAEALNLITEQFGSVNVRATRHDRAPAEGEVGFVRLRGEKKEETREGTVSFERTSDSPAYAVYVQPDRTQTRYGLVVPLNEGDLHQRNYRDDPFDNAAGIALGERTVGSQTTSYASYGKGMRTRAAKIIRELVSPKAKRK